MPDGTAGVRVAGRIVSLRYFGKLAFGHLYDVSGKVQFAAQKTVLNEQFDDLKRLVDIGDIIVIEGEMITTKKGEKPINAQQIFFLTKSLRSSARKFHGLMNPGCGTERISNL